MLIGTPSIKLIILAKSIAKCSVVVLTVFISNGLSAASLTSPESPLAQSLGTLELTINNKNTHCELQAANKTPDETKTIPLLLKSPCYWISSTETKTLLQYSYEAVAADNTLLIAGTPLDWSLEKKTYQKLPDNAYCTQFLQGVVISKNQVFAVDERMIAAHCETGLAIDEKIFYAMAHNPKRYQEKRFVPNETVDAPTKKPADKAKEILSETIPTDTVKAEEKSFLDSVTDTVKDFFSGQSKDAK